MIFHFFPPSIPKEVFLYSRSRSVSLRGMNVSSSENKNNSSQDERYMAIQQMLDHVNNFGTFCFSFFASTFFFQHREAISNLSFAKDEASLLACASLDGTLSICEVSPVCRVLHLLSGHAAGVTGNVPNYNKLLAQCRV